MKGNVKTRLNFRENATLEAKVLMELEENTVLNVNEDLGDWLHVTVDNINGYVMKAYVKCYKTEEEKKAEADAEAEKKKKVEEEKKAEAEKKKKVEDGKKAEAKAEKTKVTVNDESTGGQDDGETATTK